jgi:manganese transport protein
VLGFAVVPLIMFTSRRRLMGVLTNHLATTIAGWGCAVVIVVLNAMLIFTTLGGTIAGLS